MEELGISIHPDDLQEHIDIFGATPPEIPCAWEDRDPEDIKQDVHRWCAEQLDRFKQKRTILLDPVSGRAALFDRLSGIVHLGEGMHARMSEVEELLQRTKRDLKKKKFFPPYGELPADYVAVPEHEDCWVDLGPFEEKLSAIMEFYARHYRWNPLCDDEDISFHGTGKEAERFWGAYRQGKAIEFYKLNYVAFAAHKQ